MTVPLAEQLLVGILVGGQSSRMGSPKGLLRAPRPFDPAAEEGSTPAPTLLERLLYISEQQLGLATVLVGARREYDYLNRTTVLDKRLGCGPLGGLVALLEHAALTGKTHAVALACDLPHLGAELLRRLAFWPSPASVVCAASGARYEPLFARYHTSCLSTLGLALDEARLGVQPLLSTLQAEVLSVSEAERQQLVDWDSPADVLASP
ncbi:MAG TPA: molybdenum cofactor guanylyltransferase [Polyangiaceae bacterium]|nr:molybdenum cofactor guanylyltransferase [Polyangiaceae bacterium]